MSVDQVGGDNENYGSARGTTGTEISMNVAISGTCTGQNYPRQFDDLLTCRPPRWHLPGRKFDLFGYAATCEFLVNGHSRYRAV